MIACPVRDFSARASVNVGDGVVISAGGVDLVFPDLGAACGDGLGPESEGLERLVLAALRRFIREVVQHGSTSGAAGGVAPGLGGLRIACRTTVPRQVGLAGSSAVIIATLRALAAHFGLPVSPFDLAEMALATEVEDLNIAAGPMDRVIQAYERVMILDLRSPRAESSYRPLDPTLVPPLLIGWTPGGGRPSGPVHSDLRERWERGDPDVVDAMHELRHLVDRGVHALEQKDVETFADLVDQNFALRMGVTSVGERDRTMVDLARRYGAAAKLCGSGGAVLVVPRGGTDLTGLERALEGGGFDSCRPAVA